MYIYKLAIQKIAEMNGEQLEKNGRFALYPNPYVDMTKDLVKRVIAEEGDVVEIKNKGLYINGEKVKLSPIPENTS